MGLVNQLVDLQGLFVHLGVCGTGVYGTTLAASSVNAKQLFRGLVGGQR